MRSRSHCYLTVLILFSVFFANNYLFAQSKTAAVAFYNVENLFDPLDDPATADEAFTPLGANRYSEKIYRQKLKNTAQVIASMSDNDMPQGPELIGLAEIENRRVLNDLMATPELLKRGYKFVHFESPDPRGIDVALLYQSRYFQVLHARAIPMLTGNHGRNERTRDVLLVSGRWGKDTVHVLVNHWPSRRMGQGASEDKRMKAAALNKLIIDSLRGSSRNANVLVMGDFNDTPADRSITSVLGAQKTMPPAGAAGLFNPFATLVGKSVGTTVHSGTWHLFDQIMLSGAFLHKGNTYRYQKAIIYAPVFLRKKGTATGHPFRSFSSFKWTGGYSDHFPVMVYFTKK
jgi:predicted extracellular nuclease